MAERSSTKSARFLRRLREEHQAYKRKCGCSVCDTHDDVQYDWHHVDPATKCDENRNNAIVWRYKPELLNKCIIVCHTCHEEIHDRERKGEM